MDENDLYKPVKNRLKELFKSVYPQQDPLVWIEITYRNESDIMQKWITDEIRDQFLRQKPDLAGFVDHPGPRGATNTLIAEVKNRDLKLQDIYQMLRYADLFQTDYSFLITSQRISEPLIRFFERRIAPIENDLHSYLSRGIILLEYSTAKDRFRKYITSNEGGAIHLADQLSDELDP